MNKTTDMKTESNTFTKRIGQTTYVVRFHYSENARETMQEKINRMLVNEVNRSDFMETEEKWLSNLMVVTTKNVFISILAILP